MILGVEPPEKLPLLRVWVHVDSRQTKIYRFREAGNSTVGCGALKLFG